MKEKTTKDKKIIIRKIVFLVLAILWMTVIFIMSARDADTSTEDSHLIGMMVGNIVYRDFDTWPEAEQISFAQKVDFPVRKCAHATEYAVLALLLSGVVFGRNVSDVRVLRKQYMIVFLICVIYGMSDEIHQYFVPGRACRLMDVCIDSAGALAGLLVRYLVTLVYLAIKK